MAESLHDIEKKLISHRILLPMAYKRFKEIDIVPKGWDMK